MLVYGNIFGIACVELSVCGTCLATPSYKDNKSIQIYKALPYFAFIISSLF